MSPTIAVYFTGTYEKSGTNLLGSSESLISIGAVCQFVLYSETLVKEQKEPDG